MQLFHRSASPSATFEETNLVSAAGLVPAMALAANTGLGDLANKHLGLPGYFGANAGLKVTALVAGMLAGADSIDDMAILRHGGMKKVFVGTYAPSTLGSFLRAFTFGHVRQLDAVACRWLVNVAAAAPIAAGIDEYALVDIDDTIKEVHGYQKQGSGYGYSGVRGLNALLGILSTTTSAPVIIGSRLRKGATGSPRGAGKFVGDILATIRRVRSASASGLVLLRADSAFYGHAVVSAAHHAGAKVSITARMDPAVKRAITTIPDDAWTTIDYTDAIRDEATGTWISCAEVAEIPFTAFSSRKTSERITGRLIVRRIPELNPFDGDGQPTLFDTHRFHAFFTTSELDTVTADKTHRGHAVIEQVNADLKNSALAHLPSGIFTANAAWLVLATIAFNLSRAIGTLAGTELGKARSSTIRRKLINIPARLSTSARRIVLHLPERWPWETGWNTLFAAACGPPRTATI
ncbi:IS1380 family transposase [Leifsonia sp. Root112D2]|uniref:IS1380 family transposase n=1 Tax=Leifsonia sp. Root112D2 TaxID=1736426 RepID=UPI0006FA6E10|nr:IS1380 family transposase [Leifsonia sp. Root112D2]KQV06460.1 transposase [Leifsonia sp. Root112D2]